ncbi:MAG: metal ABC transporter solute-binding protein, Zn/Mn family [Bacillota bacterium]
MNRKLVIVVVLIMVFSISSLTNAWWFLEQDKVESDADKREVIYTSVYPLYEVANRIAGDKLDVRLVVPNGTELHGYKPSAQKMAKLEQADIFFYVGLGLESWADKAVDNLSATGVETVRVSEGVNLRKFKNNHRSEELDSTAHTGHDHQEAHEEDHKEADIDHTSYDPHIWLDPLNMKQIAQQMTEKFSQLDQEHSEFYQNRYQDFTERINKLDKEFQTALANKDQEYILVSHSAFGYLGDRYGFKQLAVTGISAHHKPSPAALSRLINQAKEHNLEYIFMETLANPRTVDVLANEADLEVLTLNPIAGLTNAEQESGADYFSIMHENLANLKRALVK